MSKHARVQYFTEILFARPKEEQVQKIRSNNAERFKQLETTIQDKLESASTRRALLELEQKEKLRNYVSKLRPLYDNARIIITYYRRATIFRRPGLHCYQSETSESDSIATVGNLTKF